MLSGLQQHLELQHLGQQSQSQSVLQLLPDLQHPIESQSQSGLQHTLESQLQSDMQQPLELQSRSVLHLQFISEIFISLIFILQISAADISVPYISSAKLAIVRGSIF